MNSKNMGGIRSLQYVLPEEVEALKTVLEDEVFLVLQPGSAWKKIPVSLSHTTVAATSQESENGTVYKHTAHLSIPLGRSAAFRLQCVRIINRGCLLLYEDNIGNKRLLGDLDHPLSGKKSINPGKKPADYADLSLDLHADLAHDAYFLR